MFRLQVVHGAIVGASLVRIVCICLVILILAILFVVFIVFAQIKSVVVILLLAIRNVLGRLGLGQQLLLLLLELGLSLDLLGFVFVETIVVVSFVVGFLCTHSIG